MTEELRTYPLVMALMKRSRVPWYWATAALAVLLLLFLLLTAFLDRSFTDTRNWNFWREFLDSPVMITYILVVYPLMWRLSERAINALQTILPLEEGSTGRQLVTPIPDRRREWIATFIGAIFWLALQQPWGWSWSEAPWLHTYVFISFSLLFGLLGWLIYSSLTGARQFSRLTRQNLKLDIFNTRVLAPVAHSSLGVSLAFIGGISLSLVFQTQESLLVWYNILIYAVLILATIVIFFLSMWSTHNAMVDAKKQRLNLVQEYLVGASRKLEDQVVTGQSEGKEDLSVNITAWLNYERRIKEVPEWPFNASIIRRLLVSTLAPVAVFLIKVFSGLGFRF